jgi:hypothetical protein
MMVFVIASGRSDEAIELRSRGFMSCFASLAMTDLALIRMMTEGKYDALA